MPKLSEEKKLFFEKLLKDRVAEVAIELLKQEKPNAFTMEEIAKGVGVSKGTLYNVFKDKQEVLWFVLTVITSKSLNFLEKILLEKQDDYKQALTNVTNYFVQHVMENSYTAVFMTVYSYEVIMEKGDLNMDEMPGMQIQKPLVEFFRRGVEAGAFKKIASPEAMAMMFISTMRGILHSNRFTSFGKVFNKSDDNEIVRLIVSMYCNED